MNKKISEQISRKYNFECLSEQTIVLLKLIGLKLQLQEEKRVRTVLHIRARKQVIDILEEKIEIIYAQLSASAKRAFRSFFHDLDHSIWWEWVDIQLPIQQELLHKIRDESWSYTLRKSGKMVVPCGRSALPVYVTLDATSHETLPVWLTSFQNFDQNQRGINYEN